VEQYGADGQVTDNNIIRYMHFGFWIPEVTNKHSEYVIITDFSTTTMVMLTHLIVTFVLHFGNKQALRICNTY